MLPKRTIGKTEIITSVLILGGHSFSDLPAKKMPDDDHAVQILNYLYKNGMTHFDCTWEKERKRFNVLLDKVGLKGKVKPVIWHGWHGRIETNADEIVESFHLMLKELGCEKAGMIIMNQWDHTEKHNVCYRNQDNRVAFADWFIDGFLRAKKEGLTEAIGWAVEPGPLWYEFLCELYSDIDFIAPFWDYRSRQNRQLITFAKDKGLGIYVVAPFRRGEDSLFTNLNIKAEQLIRPWLKWIFAEQAVFATTISLPSLTEAEMVVNAIDDQPLSLQEKKFLNHIEFSIRQPK